MAKQVRPLDRVVIRFAGDSGDGMQLTGDRFTSETASFGNDLSTLPNFPAEIRAPAGTLPGVSSFQVHFADYDILTPGDAPNVLVEMNPAALKANLADLPAGARISAGKFGNVEMSLPSWAVSDVNRSPVSCMPSPESPANRMTTRVRWTTSRRTVAGSVSDDVMWRSVLGLFGDGHLRG